MHGLAGCTRGAPAQARFDWSCVVRLSGFSGGFGDRSSLLVDGHIHYHVLPMFFDELLALARSTRLRHSSASRALVLATVRNLSQVSCLNVTKCVVLRAFCRVGAGASRAWSDDAEAFIGVLGTWRMTLEYVSAALNRLQTVGSRAPLRFLFHPGRARRERSLAWDHRPELQEFYLLENGIVKAELLRSSDFGHLLSAYRARAAIRPAHSAEVAR
jgi:hypothetical protein